MRNLEIGIELINQIIKKSERESLFFELFLPVKRKENEYGNIKKLY